jgi:RNA polymerase primary sigma factor
MSHVELPPRCGSAEGARETFQARLVAAAKEGDAQARDELVAAFQPLIAGSARAYGRSPAVDHAELMQEGVVGLLRALRRFDPGRGTPFWGFASAWVRQAMQRLVSEMTGPVVLSDRAARQLARVKVARRHHLEAHGSEPTTHELATEASMTMSQVQSLIAAERRPRGLEEQVGGGGDGRSATFGELLADPRAEDAYEQVGGGVGAEVVPDLLGGLEERERAILRGRFGFDGPELTLRELADDIGLSAERVRQIEEHALDKLRAPMVA